MKLISHRGNIDGPNNSQENNPEYIDNALKFFYDVEVDLRLKNDKFYLGHDEPQYYVSMIWLVERKDNLWIHCKDLDCLNIFSNSPIDFNYFWHQEDDYTLTSKNFIWTYPGKEYKSKSVIVMPEWDNMSYDELKNVNCYGVCSDYVKILK
jgi:hypothetical protein